MRRGWEKHWEKQTGKQKDFGKQTLRVRGMYLKTEIGMEKRKQKPMGKQRVMPKDSLTHWRTDSQREKPIPKHFLK